MISLTIPTRFSEVTFALLPRVVRAKSFCRRVLNMRASDTTRAALHLQFVFLGQEGIGELDHPAMIDKSLSQYTEREACALIAASRERLRKFVREFNAIERFDGFKSAVTISHPVCAKCGGPSHQNANGSNAAICGWCEAHPEVRPGSVA